MGKDNRRICRIDGDFYEVTLPTAGIWQDMYQHPNVPGLSSFLRHNRCVLYGKEKETLFINYQVLLWSTSKFAKNPDANFGNEEDVHNVILLRPGISGNFDMWELHSSEKAQISILPMLIPLDQSLCDVSDQFQMENPNGSIVYGGNLQYETDTSSNGNHGHSKTSVPHILPETQWEIGDSGDQPLKWFVWNGKLFCSRILFTTYPKDILNIFQNIY